MTEKQSVFYSFIQRKYMSVLSRDIVISIFILTVSLLKIFGLVKRYNRYLHDHCVFIFRIRQSKEMFRNSFLKMKTKRSFDMLVTTY